MHYLELAHQATVLQHAFSPALWPSIPPWHSSSVRGSTPNCFLEAEEWSCWKSAGPSAVAGPRGGRSANPTAIDCDLDETRRWS